MSKTNIYELGYLLDLKLGEDATEKEASRIEETITKNGGLITERTLPKKRRLSYRIKHNGYAFFGVVLFSVADSSSAKKIERELELDKNVIRHIMLQYIENKSPSAAAQKATAKMKFDAIEETPKKQEPIEEPVKPTTPAAPAPQMDLDELDQKLEEILSDK
jgi:ribosomal protein S6